jgi:hypothetical protein
VDSRSNTSSSSPAGVSRARVAVGTLGSRLVAQSGKRSRPAVAARGLRCTTARRPAAAARRGTVDAHLRRDVDRLHPRIDSLAARTSHRRQRPVGVPRARVHRRVGRVAASQGLGAPRGARLTAASSARRRARRRDPGRRPAASEARSANRMIAASSPDGYRYDPRNPTPSAGGPVLSDTTPWSTTPPSSAERTS